MPEITPPITTAPTLGLCVMTAEMTDELAAKLADLTHYVDRIYVQINGKKKPKPGTFSYYRWNDDFAAARNALVAEVETDYWTWMDADDELRSPERLRDIVRHMDETGVSMVFAPYEYNQTNGIVSELQFRERIIKTDLPGAWHGAVHETWIPEVATTRETEAEVVWVHQATKAHFVASMKRNRRILEREYQQQPRDPRVAYYLGLNYGMDGHYKEAIDCFYELIRTSGWDEEIYRAWIQIFSCSFELKDYEQAEMAAFRAMTVLPEWPDAYLMLQQLYYTVDDHQKSLEWYRVGLSKPQPDTDSAYNPVVRLYQPHELAAYSYLATGDPEKALTTAQTLVQLKPNYPLKSGLKAEIRRGVEEYRVITSAKFLMAHVGTATGARLILESLPPELRADIRLTEERRRYIPGKTWPKGSIVFYCGPSFEPWGPDTLENGMGGSEEAVVYLAREFAEQGHEVHVYNQRTSSILDQWDGDDPSDPENDEPMTKAGGMVTYWPWTAINPNDTFDTFVAWRSPAGIEGIKARRKIVDLHDVIAQEDVYAAIPYVDTFLFKSQFHRGLYPEVPDEKAVVIGNGIRPEDVA